MSHKLNKHEVNYSQPEKECLAMVLILKNFRHYLLGNYFIYYTDCSAVKDLINKPNLSGKFARWVMTIQDYNFTIKHIKGKDNTDADALSHLEIEDLDDDSDLDSEGDELMIIERDEFDLYIMEEHKMQLDQVESYLKTLIVPEEITHQKQFIKKTKRFTLMNGILYRCHKDGVLCQVVKLNSQVQHILEVLHDMDCGGHFAVDGTYKKISMQYWWPGMGKDIEDYVKSCEKCQFRSRYLNEEPLQVPPIPTLFAKWGVDIVGPVPRSKSGFQYMVFATDYFSGWVCGRQLRYQTAGAVAKFVYEEVITKHGCPKEMVSDQGSQFMGEVFMILLKTMSIKHRRSAAYNPQANGRAERTNKIIVDTMAKLAVEYQKNWEEVFDAAMWAYNTTVIKGCQHSPFFLKYGMEARLPVDFSIKNGLDVSETMEDRLNRLIELQKT